MTERPARHVHDEDAPAVVALLRRMRAVTDDRTPHLWNGACPEAEDGHSNRDPACPACAVLAEADAFLAGWSYADTACRHS